jgi:hypothetical protein
MTFSRHHPPLRSRAARRCVWLWLALDICLRMGDGSAQGDPGATASRTPYGDRNPSSLWSRLRRGRTGRGWRRSVDSHGHGRIRGCLWYGCHPSIHGEAPVLLTHKGRHLIDVLFMEKYDGRESSNDSHGMRRGHRLLNRIAYVRHTQRGQCLRSEVSLLRMRSGMAISDLR